MSIVIHTSEDFSYMRKSGALAASVLDFIEPYVVPGVTTSKINDLCHEFIVGAGAIPAPLGYKGFPKSVCTSKNSVVCHGIPNDALLREGEILNIDVAVILDSWHGDTSKMFFVGKCGVKAKRVCKAAFEALHIGIKQVRPGVMLGKIGEAIQEHIHGKYGYSLVRDQAGHGIGRVFHDEPTVLHYKNKYSDIELQEGMFFTIEPMVNVGGHHTVLCNRDKFTVTTKDMSLSAQYEHTIGVTSEGCEIFTLSSHSTSV